MEIGCRISRYRLSLIVEKRSGVGLIHLSDYTYTVFLLSYFPQMLVRGPIAHAFPEVNQYLFSCVSFVLGFSLPILFGVIYRRVKDANRLTRFVGLSVGRDWSRSLPLCIKGLSLLAIR